MAHLCRDGWPHSSICYNPLDRFPPRCVSLSKGCRDTPRQQMYFRETSWYCTVCSLSSKWHCTKCSLASKVALHHVQSGRKVPRTGRKASLPERSGCHGRHVRPPLPKEVEKSRCRGARPLETRDGTQTRTQRARTHAHQEDQRPAGMERACSPHLADPARTMHADQTLELSMAVSHTNQRNCTCVWAQVC